MLDNDPNLNKANGVATQPVVGILMNRCPKTGEPDLAPRWLDALKQWPLTIIKIEPDIHPDDLDILLEQLDGIMLPGGDSNIHPSRYGQDPLDPEAIYGSGQVPKFSFDHERDKIAIYLVKESIKRDIPILGVCRGFQEMIVACGGALQQVLKANGSPYRHEDGYHADEDKRFEPVHGATFLPNGILSKIFRFFGTVAEDVYLNSVHRQGIGKDHVPEELYIEAIACDSKTVEAVSLPGHSFFLGVQFHAESNGKVGRSIYAAFIEAVWRKCFGLPQPYSAAGTDFAVPSPAEQSPHFPGGDDAQPAELPAPAAPHA